MTEDRRKRYAIGSNNYRDSKCRGQTNLRYFLCTKVIVLRRKFFLRATRFAQILYGFRYQQLEAYYSQLICYKFSDNIPKEYTGRVSDAIPSSTFETYR